MEREEVKKRMEETKETRHEISAIVNEMAGNLPDYAVRSGAHPTVTKTLKFLCIKLNV